MNVGQHIRVKTKTKDDVFGSVLYRLEQTGVHCPHCKSADDGMWFLMLGGTGPSATAGRKILDCQKNVERDIAAGVTVLVNPDEARQFTGGSDAPKTGGTGIAEVDW